MALDLPLTANSGATFTPASDALSGFDLSDLTGDLGEGLGIGLLKPARKIGTVIPECVIEEQARDDNEITRHPIETGAPITDHVFALPPEVVVRCGWSDSGSLPGYSKRAYAALRELKDKREPFDLITGKRTLTNMLIVSISTTTNAATEHALIATVVCRQVVIVRASVATIGPRSTQAAPQATGATETGGNRQSVPASSTSGANSNRTILGRGVDAINTAVRPNSVTNTAGP